MTTETQGNVNAIEAAALGGADFADLKKAVEALEHPSLAARLTSVLGTPIEEGLKLLPSTWYAKLNKTTEAVMHRTLDIAVSTLPGYDGQRFAGSNHRNISVLTGAAGGLFGLPGTLTELPFATMIMLRSIASIAAQEGEDLSEMDSRLSCLEVFALGGPSRSDDAAETGYYGLRLMMAYNFSVIAHAAANGAVLRQLPAVVAFVRSVAARFGIVVSEKAAMSSVPLFGAASGAIVNAVFIDHFDRIARGHFTIRRLERRYGQELIRSLYRELASSGSNGDIVIAQEESILPYAFTEPAAPALREVHNTTVVAASPDVVFDIVANVRTYPDFLEHCLNAELIRMREHETIAELRLKTGGSEATYPVRLTLERPERITMDFELEPPLRLQAEWGFAAIDESRCRLDVTTRYEAGGRARAMLVKPLVQRLSSQLLDAVIAEVRRTG